MPLFRRELPKSVYSQLEKARAEKFARSLIEHMKKEAEENPSHFKNIAEKYAKHLGEKAQILLADPVPTIIYWTISSLPLPGLIDDASSKNIVKEFFPAFNPPGFRDENYEAVLKHLGVTKFVLLMKQNPHLARQASEISRMMPLQGRLRIASTRLLPPSASIRLLAKKLPKSYNPRDVSRTALLPFRVLNKLRTRK